jgi:hypothetical protein
MKGLKHITHRECSEKLLEIVNNFHIHVNLYDKSIYISHCIKFDLTYSLSLCTILLACYIFTFAHFLFAPQQAGDDPV